MRNLVGMSSIKYVLFKKNEKYSAGFKCRPYFFCIIMSLF